MAFSDLQTKKVSSFRRRLALVFTGFAFAIAFTFTSINLISDINTMNSNASGKVNLLTKHLAITSRIPMFSGDILTLQQLADEVAAVRGVFSVSITGAEGKPLASAGRPPGDPQVNPIFSELPVYAEQTTKGAEQALGLATEQNHRPLGKVTVVMDSKALREGINRQAAISVLTFLIFWLAFALLGSLIVKWIHRALAPLVEGLRTIQRGDFSLRIPAIKYEELAEAATAINELAEGLQVRDELNSRLQEELLDSMKNEVRQERRQMMAKLIQTNRMTSLGLQTSSMSHEINTPNGAIRLAGQQLSRVWNDAVPILDRVAEDEGDFVLGGLEYSVVKNEVNKGLEIISRSSERIGQVISDLRTYSLGEQNPVNGRIDLNKVASDALSLVMAHGRQGTVRFERRFQQCLPEVSGNSYNLVQVVTNLLMNGIQAIAPETDGLVTITTGSRPDDNQVFLTVQDNGEGISKEHRQHVLEPFFSTRIEVGGSGLGLYIANFIITGHKGTLSFDSAPGAGTSVTITLPTAGDAAPRT